MYRRKRTAQGRRTKQIFKNINIPLVYDTSSDLENLGSDDSVKDPDFDYVGAKNHNKRNLSSSDSTISEEGKENTAKKRKRFNKNEKRRKNTAKISTAKEILPLAQNNIEKRVINIELKPVNDIKTHSDSSPVTKNLAFMTSVSNTETLCSEKRGGKRRDGETSSTSTSSENKDKERKKVPKSKDKLKETNTLEILENTKETGDQLKGKDAKCDKIYPHNNFVACDNNLNFLPSCDALDIDDEMEHHERDPRNETFYNDLPSSKTQSTSLVSDSICKDYRVTNSLDNKSQDLTKTDNEFDVDCNCVKNFNDNQPNAYKLEEKRKNESIADSLVEKESEDKTIPFSLSAGNSTDIHSENKTKDKEDSELSSSSTTSGSCSSCSSNSTSSSSESDSENNEEEKEPQTIEDSVIKSSSSVILEKEKETSNKLEEKKDDDEHIIVDAEIQYQKNDSQSYENLHTNSLSTKSPSTTPSISDSNNDDCRSPSVANRTTFQRIIMYSDSDFGFMNEDPIDSFEEDALLSNQTENPYQLENTTSVNIKLDTLTESFKSKQSKSTSIVPYSNTESSDSDEDCTQSRPLSRSLLEIMLPEDDVAGSSDAPIDHPVSKRKSKSRRKKAEPNKWMRNQAKILRNQGKSYLSNSKTNRQEKPERQIKNACTDKCKLKCSLKITNTQRETIFTNYWALGDLQRQREFILRHISKVKPRYSYKVHNSNRGHNNAFYFTLDQQRIRVCKAFFKATLDISDRVIKTVVQKSNTDDGMLCLDYRGKHKNHKTVDLSIKDSVRQHINSIPRIESHYCRADTKRQFIEGGKSISDLHRDYVKEQKEKGLPYANYLMYNHMFNDEFNLSFFQPKKDQCEDCVAFSNATEEEKVNLQGKMESHLKEKELARDEKDNDKTYTPDNCIVAVYDLQAVMPCPKGDVSNFYYLSKLNVYNFTIYNLKNHDVACFVWHEGQGQRGVNEIGSCVLRYIENLKDTARQLESNLDLIFFSDNCCGQQKNHFMIALYVYVVTHFEFINSITHKFLIKGHTQNEGDSAHSVIERQIKKSLKSSPIYSPDQYYQIIRIAKKEGNPYKVTEMLYDDFVDIKALAASIGKNFTKNTDKEAVKLSEIKVVKVSSDETDEYSFAYKTSYTSNDYKKVIIDKHKKNTRNSRNNNNEPLKKAYRQQIRICEKKKKGLLGLINKNIVPRFYTLFYESL